LTLGTRFATIRMRAPSYIHLYTAATLPRPTTRPGANVGAIPSEKT